MAKGRSQPAVQTVQQTSNNDPWAPLIPHLTELFTRGRTALDQTPNTADQTYAGPNADQRRALDVFRGVATGADAGAADLRRYGTDLASGRYLDPATNPFIGGAVTAATRGITDRLQREILPSLADQAILQGAYGGSGYGVAQGVAAGDWSRNAGDIAATMYYNNYQAERDRMGQAGSILNQANELFLQPGRLLDLAGGQQQAWDQAALDAAIRAPWNGLGQYAQLLGLGTGYGTQTTNGTTTTQQPRASGFGSFLQGAAGGAGAGATFGPWGAGIGGLLGGLGGLFG